MTGELSVLSIPGGTLGAEAFGSQGQRALLTIDAASVDVSTIKVLNIPGGNIASAPSSVGSSVYAIVTMTLTEAAGHEWREFWLGNIRLTRVQMTDTRYWALLIIDVADATVVNYRNYQVDGGVITTVYTGVARYHALLTLSKDSVTAANVRAFQLPTGVISRQEMTTQGFFAFLTSGGGIVLPSYLFHDQTTPDQSAPLSSPVTVSPGPGTLNKTTDAADKVRYVSGGVVIDQNVQLTDPLYYWADNSSNPLTRVSGLVLAARWNTTLGRIYWVTKAAAPMSLTGSTGGIQLQETTIGYVFTNVGLSLLFPISGSGLPVGLGLPIDVYLVALSTGLLVFARLDGVNVSCIYHCAVGSGNIIDGFATATVSAVAGQGVEHDHRVWNIRNTAILTPAFLQASPTLLNDYVGFADGLFSLTVICPNPLTGNTFSWQWRKSDANNYHEILLGADGSMRAYKVVAGVLTEYSSAINVASVTSAAQTRRFVVHALANKIEFVSELATGSPTQRGNVITDTFNQTATGTSISSTGASSWTPTNLTIYPITSSAYNTEFPPGQGGTLCIFVGDSITFGTGINPPTSNTYPFQFRALHLGKYDVYNEGVAGDTVDLMIAAFPAKVAPYGSGWTKKIVTITGFSNNINGSDTAQQIYDKIVTLCGLARAAGFLVNLLGSLPRGDSSGAQETKRQTVNTMLGAAGTAIADHWRDPSLNASLDDPNDATYYQAADKVHPTVVGAGVLATEAEVGIVALAP